MVTFHIPIDGSQAQDKKLLEKIKIKIKLLIHNFYKTYILF
jgi:hypothetical protein